MQVLRFEPGAEPGIVDFGLTLPEVGLEAALDAQMAELQLDVLRALGEVAADIVGSNVQSREAVTFALRFDDHRSTCYSKSAESGPETGQTTPA